MKAIQISEFGPPSVLKLVEHLEVPKPKNDEILIEIKSVGVNPVDTYKRSGNFKVLPKIPWIPGSDCAGIVSEIGEHISKTFSVGQRVFTSSTITGSYANYALVKSLHVHILPDYLSFQQGSSIGTPYFTAYGALFQRGQAKLGETVMIHGATGGVGIACIQLAKVSGLTVIGTAGSPEGMKLITDQGADFAFNHRETDYVTKIQNQFNGKINLIIEMLANVNLVNDCNIAAPRARIMIVGNRGSLDFDPRLVMMKLLEIRGVALFSNTEDEWKEAGEMLDVLLQKEKICPVISKEYALEDARLAHEDIISGNPALGKLVLNVN